MMSCSGKLVKGAKILNSCEMEVLDSNTISIISKAR